MENFETWLLSQKLTDLYLAANGWNDSYKRYLVKLYSGGKPGEYVSTFTREMLKLYETLTEVNQNCFDTVDELLLELESLNKEIAAYKKIVKTLIYLLEGENE